MATSANEEHILPRHDNAIFLLRRKIYVFLEADFRPCLQKCKNILFRAKIWVAACQHPGEPLLPRTDLRLQHAWNLRNRGRLSILMRGLDPKCLPFLLSRFANWHPWIFWFFSKGNDFFCRWCQSLHHVLPFLLLEVSRQMVVGKGGFNHFGGLRVFISWRST